MPSECVLDSVEGSEVKVLMLDSNKGQMTQWGATVMGLVATYPPQGMRQRLSVFRRRQPSRWLRQ